jgi:16S rRNA (guanine527-N7)-methyltransferase
MIRDARDPASPVPPEDALLVAHLIGAARALGFSLADETGRSLVTWLKRLLDENKRINLTGIEGLEEAADRLAADSLAVGLHLAEHPLAPGSAVLDLGTGGGIPGIPLALARPELHHHLVESRRRKADAVRRIVQDLGIPNVTVHGVRLRELLQRPGGAFSRSMALVIVRAVGPLPDLVREAAPALAPGGCIVAWKSRDLSSDERTAGLAQATRAGLHPLSDIPYEAYKPSLLIRFQRSESPDG